MKRWKFIVAAAAAAVVAGCGSGETTAPSAPASPDRSAESTRASERSSSPSETRADPLEPDAVGWMTAGERSRGGLITEDGSTDSRAARIVLDGRGIATGAAGSGGWLLASRDAWFHELDGAEGFTDPAMEGLGGEEQLESVAAGNGGWLALGRDGTIQWINEDGQPSNKTAQPFGTGVTVAGAAFRSSNWLVGSATGSLRRVETSSLDPREETLTIDAAVLEIVGVPSRWLVFTPGGFVPVSGGETDAARTLVNDAEITTVAARNDTVAVGTDDGRVLVSPQDELTSNSFEDVLEGSKVRALASSEAGWLAAGDDGTVRRLEADGAPEGSVKTVAGETTLVAARSHDDGWSVGSGSLSAVQQLDSELAGTDAGQTELLGGAEVHAVTARPGALLAVGADGAYRLLEPDGTPNGEVQHLESGETLRAAGWDGEHFLVAGDGGRVAILDESGEVTSSKTLLEGAQIRGVAWSGKFWLLASGDGTYQRLRRDGSAFRESSDSGLSAIHSTQFNGSEWMLAGARDGTAAFMLLRDDGTVAKEATDVLRVDGSFAAVGWNGREWLAGTDAGWVARIDQAGSIIEQGRNEGVRRALHEFAIRAISFNGNRYLVGGENGAVRRLGSDALPHRPASILNDFSTIRSIVWTEARGFRGGPCVSKDFCLEGACKGRVGEGFCCESSCEGPCQSCYEDVTGQSDGFCDAIPEGEEPPERKQSEGQTCPESSEGSCGKNGLCDGSGSCAFYGQDVVCQEASCTDGQTQPAATCDGQGSCVVPDEKSCEPYAGCDGSSCPDSCDSDEDCASGSTCRDGACVDPDSEGNGDVGTVDAEPSDDPVESGGCGSCSTATPNVPAGGAIVVLLLMVGYRRRN